MDVTIYHNPKCSKSRQTLDLLREKGVTPRIVEYLKTPPDAAEIRQILTELGLAPRDLVRRKESAYKEAGLDDPAVGDSDLVAAMVRHPVLIERPIVRANGKATIGRPPERVLDIL
ncbi:MAG: arsenate reductase (glutaredoxin) [Alphaproteobacteria bacterium]